MKRRRACLVGAALGGAALLALSLASRGTEDSQASGGDDRRTLRSSALGQLPTAAESSDLDVATSWLGTRTKSCEGPFIVRDVRGTELAAKVEGVPADGTTVVRRGCGWASYAVEFDDGTSVDWSADVLDGGTIEIVVPDLRWAEVEAIGVEGRVGLLHRGCQAERRSPARFWVACRSYAATLILVTSGSRVPVWVPMDEGHHRFDIGQMESQLVPVEVTCDPGPCPVTLLCDTEPCVPVGSSSASCRCPADRAVTFVAVEDVLPEEAGVWEPARTDVTLYWPQKPATQMVDVTARWTGKQTCTFSPERLDVQANVSTTSFCGLFGSIRFQVPAEPSDWRLTLVSGDGAEWHDVEFHVDEGSTRVNLGRLAPSTSIVRGRILGIPIEDAGSVVGYLGVGPGFEIGSDGSVEVRAVEPGSLAHAQIYTATLGVWSATGWLEEGFEWEAEPGGLEAVVAH